MIDRIVVRFEKGKGIIETGTNDALNLLKLASEHGLIEGGKIEAIDGRAEEIGKIEKEKLSGELKDKIPSVDDIVNYILSQNDFKHTTCDTNKHFFGRELESRGSDKVAYNAAYRGLREAHKIIESDYNGRWESQWGFPPNGKKCKLYTFRKNEKAETKSEEESVYSADRRKTSNSEIEKRIKEPTTGDVRTYILNKGVPFEHSMSKLTKHFFERRLYQKGEDSRIFNRVYRRAKEVRKEIEQQNQGHWIKVAVGDDRKTRDFLHRFVLRDEKAVALGRGSIE